ncbi:ABC transporter ATP-binding protein [Dactylosporangium sp. NPDC000555]|uniref:ABC transporter ATP-binding protein n=1 Tax=Dactylosporangium sp. NPDC000555 TaxID=3154260 RepID=UPI00332AA6DB
MRDHEDPADEALLEVSNLRVRYKNGALGVRDVSFTVGTARIVALLGANGAGKTTTVRAISGFLRSEGARVQAGTIRLGSQDITNWEPHQICKRGVCIVPERRKVFANLSVSENLNALGAQMPRGAAKAAVEERVFGLFPTLADRRRELAGRLSGGQQQMLAIGRALMSDPKLLIIDEMTLGLHHSLHEPLFEAIKGISRSGSAVIMVDESTRNALDVADHCVLLASGQVRVAGASESFVGNELLVAGYVDA